MLKKHDHSTVNNIQWHWILVAPRTREPGAFGKKALRRSGDPSSEGIVLAQKHKAIRASSRPYRALKGLRNVHRVSTGLYKSVRVLVDFQRL